MASLTDKITDVRNGARPNSARVTSARSIGGTTLSCNSLTGWPTASKVHFVTYQIDSSNNPIDGTQLDCVGIRSGNDLTQVSVIDGTDGGSSIGDVVEMLPTAAWGQDLADALTKEHDRDGSHNSTAFVNFANSLYPIGSIYTNAAVSTNPSTLLGFGTWVEFGTGRVLVGIDTGQTEFDTLGKSGGAKTHTLTEAEMPAHKHTIRAEYGANASVSFPPSNGGSYMQLAGTGAGTRASITSVAENAGSGSSHNNLQPYITVYMWRRIA